MANSADHPFHPAFSGGAEAAQANGGKPRRVLYVTDFYLEEMLAGVAEHALAAGWHLDANMRFHGQLPALKEADGILATATSERIRDWLAEWKGGPIIRLLSTPLEVPYPAVEPDYREAGRAGARHLLELGHVHYAYYFLHSLPSEDEVRDGFMQELAGRGRFASILDLPAAFPGRCLRTLPRDERERWLAAELKRLPRPLAVMSGDDRRSLEILGACGLAGLRVPEDVAILGCDNSAIEQAMSRLPLSSVDMNFRALGRNAARLLGGLMEGKTPPSVVIKTPPAGVVARQSSATFAVESPEITAAMLYLREHFPERLRVVRLARVAGLSLRVFQSEFKRWTGRSVHEEIQRVRLAQVARLLRDTDLKLDAIAAECGFSSGRYMASAFFEVYRIRPSAWRQSLRRPGTAVLAPAA